MQIDESGAVEVVEPDTELVLVTGRRIEPGALFWPEEDALYLLASTWEAVDPLDDDDDSVSRMVITREKRDMEHKAMQELVQLTFTPQPGGVLWRAVGFLGAVDVFGDVSPSLGALLSLQEALGPRFGLVLLCNATWNKYNVLRYTLDGCAMAADIPFSPVP